MASYNQMKSQGNNGGSGRYTSSGFIPSRNTNSESKRGGCGLWLVLAIVSLVGGGILSWLA